MEALPPVPSTSAAIPPPIESLDAATPTGRQKHQCIIPVRGEPCKSCKSRGKDCTFDQPPVVRIRKPKEQLAPGEQAVDNAPARPVRMPSSTPSSLDRRDSSSWVRPLNATSSSTALLSFLSEAQTPLRPEPPSPSTTNVLTTDSSSRHFISASAFSDSTFSVEDQHTTEFPGDVGFSQISNDPSFPVFFVQTPMLMYGTVAPSGQGVWQAACSMLPAGMPAHLLETCLRQTQPALPILDTSRFINSDPATLIAHGVSYGLLTSLLAHSTCYVTDIRSHHKTLWRSLLTLLEDEYRQPTLQTIQVALIVINSRPAINVGQNTIAMGRSTPDKLCTQLISAGQLLGLHLDPAQWRISPAERVLRKRLWWAIVLTDKWRAAFYGRPSNLSLEDTNVPLLALADFNTTSAFASDIASAESFIAWTKLTLVLDSILVDFFTVRALTSPKPASERLKKLELLAFELALLERDLPDPLQDLPSAINPPTEAAATGVRSFQLCKMGVSLILYRLTASSLLTATPTQRAASTRTGLTLSQTLVEFLENLTSADYGVFWAPYCSFIISSAAALLIRTALTAKNDQATRTTCGVLFTRLVVTLTSSHHAARWDVASLALDRIATLLRSLSGELPELVPLLQLFGPPNHTPADPSISTARPPPHAPSAAFSPSQQPPHLPPTVSPSHTSHPLPSYPQPSPSHANLAAAPPPAHADSAVAQASPSSAQADPFWWMHTEIMGLPEHFEDLPDVWEGWGLPAGEEGFAAHPTGAGMDAVQGQGEGEAFDLLRFLQGPAGGNGAASGAA
ncbi:hypothetical protein JCM10207_000342 [Rhodosporidiobolus poonsookiae]